MRGEANDPALDGPSAALIRGLEWLWGRVTRSGAFDTEPGIGTDRQIDYMIRLAYSSAGAAGFVTNLGGLFTLPVAIPANLLSAATIQLALVAKIAAARGYDVHSPETQQKAFLCLCGTSVAEVLKDLGIRAGKKLTQQAVAQIGGATVTKINQAVGFRLLAKAGSQGVVNLTKFIPVAGGVLSGSFDALTTKAVGEVAKTLFPRLNSGLGVEPSMIGTPEPRAAITHPDRNLLTS